MKKLLWIGDGVANTGFATVTHSVLDRLHGRYDITLFALNYYGDRPAGTENAPDWPYKIIPSKNEITGKKLRELWEAEQPDVVCVVQDPWVLSQIVPMLFLLPEPVRTFAYAPVDAPNLKPSFVRPLGAFQRIITYTQFGKAELLKAGLDHEPAVIPHGVDPATYFPIDRAAAKASLGLKPDDFVIGYVARNQPRKRQDIAIRAFSQWVHQRQVPPNVYLYLHCCRDDVGWDLEQLASFYGVAERLRLTAREMNPAKGVPVPVMRTIFNCMDLHLNVGHGEGWGLPNMESMACGVPQIVGNYSALAEWPGDAVHRVPVSDYYHNVGKLNTIGGVVDERLLIDSLDFCYRNADYRKALGQRGYERVREPQFGWDNIANAFGAAFDRDDPARAQALAKYRGQFSAASTTAKDETPVVGAA